MKMNKSQICIALICGFLGFSAVYHFKLYSKPENDTKGTDIISDVEELQKEKEELLKENKKLSEQVENYKNGTANEYENERKVQNAEMYLGISDVTGPGIILTITPKASMFTSNAADSGKALGENEIVHLVNILWYAEAEAVSVNDYRITAQTGIKTSGNNISIGGEGVISSKDKIEIKVIGNVERLKAAMEFPGSFDYGALVNYNCEVETGENIKIPKSRVPLTSDYMSAEDSDNY